MPGIERLLGWVIALTGAAVAVVAMASRAMGLKGPWTAAVIGGLAALVLGLWIRGRARKSALIDDKQALLDHATMLGAQRGEITAYDLATATATDEDQAEQALRELARGGAAEIDSDRDGRLVFRFRTR